jgi:hypothetical protein
MVIPGRLYITPYYRDAVQNEKDQAPLEHYAALAYDEARWGDPREAQDILGRWGRTCLEVVNAEAEFAMTYWGQLFLEAYLLMDPREWDSEPFIIWVDRVYRPCAWKAYYKYNNHGSWGILGTALAYKVLGWDTHSIHSRLVEHISNNVSDSGVMIHEIKRTNSGMWYSYFSLAPMLRACQVLNVPGFAELLRKPLAWLFGYCQAPETWPYRLPGGFRGWITKMLYPCADEVEIPKPDNWPGNLYYAAGRYLEVPEWAAWAPPPSWNEIFRERQ